MSATTRMTFDARGVPPYAPAARDPMRLSQATVNAVDAIGERTAKEVEASADERNGKLTIQRRTFANSPRACASSAKRPRNKCPTSA